MRLHPKGKRLVMKKQKISRRALLKNSAALGLAATLPLSSVVLAGCSSKNARSGAADGWRELPVPAPLGSLTPRASVRPGGTALLSWLEPNENGTASFRFSRWEHGTWSRPAIIAEGRPFSRDRASAPGVTALSGQDFIAYWSQKPVTMESAGNAIELYMAASTDGGAHWASPMLVNRSSAQPGEDNAYASAAALDESRATLIWLDGRNWDKQNRVQLMSRTVRPDGTMNESTLLDPDTCTCCSTALVGTGSGLLAAYRGHTPANIRDISSVRTAGAGWSQPRIVHPDQWHIEACPVNGPHLNTAGNRVALIWFTAPQDQPSVQLAFSQNGGTDFAPPLRMNTGRAMGRAQVALSPGDSAVTFWLEIDSGVARILARRIHNQAVLDAPFELSRGANLGYPHAVRTDDGILLAWAEKGAVSRVRVGILSAG
jgi:hypothetical protein